MATQYEADLVLAQALFSYLNASLDKTLKIKVVDLLLDFASHSAAMHTTKFQKATLHCILINLVGSPEYSVMLLKHLKTFVEAGLLTGVTIDE